MNYRMYGLPPAQNRGGGYILLRNYSVLSTSFNHIGRLTVLVEGGSGDYFDWVDSAAFGTSVVIKVPGYYAVKASRVCTQAAGITGIGISRNATVTECSTALQSMDSSPNNLGYVYLDDRTVSEEATIQYCWDGPLNAGDVLRFHLAGNADIDASSRSRFSVCFIRPL